MKILGIAIWFSVAVAAALLIAGQLGLLKGSAPKNLGVKNGLFRPPSLTPNSVSSQADLHVNHPQQAYSRIEPLRFTGDGTQAMDRLEALVRATDRTEVVTREPGYLYAQSTTALLKFTDDIEFGLDTSNSVIHVRSASRLGSKDFNVNRARVEAIRAQFEKN